ncbi:MAG TPA: polysaccharide biosynthesis/export family protein [Terriglobales bacterium]|nr:polysaccharide biosynthesis/export family protein [Terriglobales bacterium]
MLTINTRTILFVVVTTVLFATAHAQQAGTRFNGAGIASGTGGSGTTPVDVPNTKEPNAGPGPTDFVIGAEDVLSINVWKEPELSHAQLRVRSDGKISLPLVGDIQASGRTTQQVQTELADRLREYIASPVVTVMVREVRSRSFNVLGEVMRPGTFPLQKSTTVVDAIALAGGFREWAKVKSIYVLRRDAGGTSQRLPFNYKKAIRGNGGDFELQSRDTIVVP